jgi:hypothetical protein
MMGVRCVVAGAGSCREGAVSCGRAEGAGVLEVADGDRDTAGAGSALPSGRGVFVGTMGTEEEASTGTGCEELVGSGGVGVGAVADR